MKLTPAFFLLLILTLASLPQPCFADEDISMEAGQHLIVVDSEGRLRNPVIKRSKSLFGDSPSYSINLPQFKSSLPGQRSEEEKYLDRIIDGIRASGKKQVLIVIHGGMNFIKGAVKRGTELSVKRENQSMSAIERDSPYYPIFVCWDSNPFSTYGDNLVNVRNGESQLHLKGRFYAWLTTPLFLTADLGRAATAAPAVFSQQVVNDLHATAPRLFDDSQAVLSRIDYANPTLNKKPLVYPVKGIDVSIGENRKSPLENATRGITYLAFLPARIATAPIIDALGKSAWENMNRRTSAMLRPQSEFLEDPQRRDHLPEEKRRNGVDFDNSGAYQAPTGGLAVFMQRLDQFYTHDPRAKGMHTTLIGHSMGAIVINQMLHYCNDATGRREDPSARKGHSSHLKLHIDHIVYMAAACTTEDFAYTVLPYLETHENTDFYNLTLHPMADYREIVVPPVDLIPRGSLLAWIDTFFGNPRTSFNRTYGKFDNAILATQILPTPIRKRIHIKAFCVGERAQLKEPQHHGSFLNPPDGKKNTSEFWQDCFWKVWAQ